MSDYTTAEQYCSRVFDGTHDTPKPSIDGHPLITSKNIKNGTIDYAGSYLISEDDYRSVQKRSYVSQWDVLFSMIGTVGNAYIEQSSDIPYAVKNVGVFSCLDRERAFWLYYYLKSPAAKKHIERYQSGAVQKFLSLGSLRSFPIPEFSIEKKNVTKVLSTLDAKIELNHRINQELEELAKLLYDYWFVQFDFPISAEQAAAMGDPTLQGKPYRQSGGKMTYNQTLKREIPAGWEVGCLPDIATFTNGIACQKYPANGGDTLRVIKIKEMRDGFTADSDIVTSSVPEKVKIDDGDLLFSWSASLEVMIWSGGKGALNQHIFKVTSDSHPRSFCYFTLLDYLKHFQMMADLRKTTMGHITKEHLDQSRIALPPAWLTDQFEQMVNPLIERMLKSHAEIHELATLRDWLLPMLMNGQVTVAP